MRRKRNHGGAAGDGGKCRMCGQVVTVGSDGRCLLGHFVGVPAAPAGADPASHEPSTSAVTTGQGPVETVGDAAAASPAGPSASAPTGPAPASVSDQDFAPDLFGDVIGAEPVETLDLVGDAADTEPGDFDLVSGTAGAEPVDTFDLFGDFAIDLPGEAPAPEPVADAGAAGRPGSEAAIGELLGWDAAVSALDADVSGQESDAGFAAAGEGDVAAPAAADQDVPSPAAADPDAAAPAAAVEHENATDEDEEALEAEDRRVARRRVLGIVGGAVAVAATVAGSVLVLPL